MYNYSLENFVHWVSLSKSPSVDYIELLVCMSVPSHSVYIQFGDVLSVMLLATQWILLLTSCLEARLEHWTWVNS